MTLSFIRNLRVIRRLCRNCKSQKTYDFIPAQETMSSEVHKAFDLRAYTSSRVDQRRMAIDAVSLSLDAEDPNSRTHPFAFPFTYQVDFTNQKVTCDNYGSKDIRDVCNYSPEVVALCEHFLQRESYDEASAYVWISGPDIYPDSRLGIGVGTLTGENTAEIKNYSGLNIALSEQECLNLAYWVNGFSPQALFAPESLSELRDQPIFVSCPEHTDRWEWLTITILKDSPLFEFINSGEADKVYQERLTTTIQLANTVAVGISRARTEFERLIWGAWMEAAMMVHFEVVLNGPTSGCGLLNLDQLATLSCKEIVCPICKWKPSSREVAEITSGSLTHCPDCGYNPSG